MNSGILVGVVTALAFLMMGLYLATYGREIRYPKGRRTVVHVSGIRILVIGPALTPAQKLYIQLAVNAVEKAWESLSPVKIAQLYPHIVFHFAEKTWHNLHGYQTYAKAMIGGKKEPMLVMHRKHLPRVDADPIVSHEMGHLLSTVLIGHPDREHTDERIWRTGLEASAARHYTALVANSKRSDEQ